MYKLDLEKAEEPEIKLSTSIGSQRKQENSRKNIYFCFTDYAKAFDCVDHNKQWDILKEVGIPEHLTCLLRKPVCSSKRNRTYMKQQTGSNLGKEFLRAVYYYPPYLTFMQSTSCKMLDWMNHESRFPEEVSITADIKMIPPL